MASNITGPQKAAAFLLALDRETSAKVMRNLDPTILSDVAQAMTELDPDLCSPEAVEGLFSEIARSAFRFGVRSQDYYELLEILQESFGPSDAEKVIADINARRRRTRPFEFLEQHTIGSVVRVLQDESPAVVALILAHADPVVSAEVLAAYEKEESLEVVRRMTAIQPPHVDILLEIADDLLKRLDDLSTAPPMHVREDSLRTVAQLLNFASGDIESFVLAGLESGEAAVAEEIREFMFSWDDLASLDRRGMQKVLTSVDTRTLALGLKSCSPVVEKNVTDNLSERVRAMVEDERDTLGAVPMSDVTEARAEILTAVRGLMESGEVRLPKAGEELVS